MMLPTCFPIEEDELFQGWLYAISMAARMPFPYYANMYLGPIGNMQYPKYFSNLESIVKRYYGVNSFFPNVYEIINEHTDYTVARLCIGDGMAAKIAEYILRENNLYMRTFKLEAYRMCPECQLEDRKQFGRSLIHVSHQINGVRVCYKHGCPLTDFSVQDISIEQKIAVFAHDLLQKKPDCTFNDLKCQIDESMVNQAVIDGYIDENEGKFLWGLVKQHNGKCIANTAIRFFAWKYAGDAEMFCHSVPTKDNSICETELFSACRSEYGIGEYVCKLCGNTFHMATRAIDAGCVCPWCGSGMTEQDRMTRILSCYRDGKYIFRDNRLIHTVCGYESRAYNMFWLNEENDCRFCHSRNISIWNSFFEGTEFEAVGMKKTVDESGKSKKMVRIRHKKCGFEFEINNVVHSKKRRVDNLGCPVCDGVGKRYRNYALQDYSHKGNSHKRNSQNSDPDCVRNIWNARIGDRKVGVNGIGCEVIGAEPSEEETIVRVRFDNGLERTMRWATFQQIGEGSVDKMPELFVGMKKIMADGRTGEIVQYEGQKKILVDFHDGTMVWSNMKRFRRGTVGIGSAI